MEADSAADEEFRARVHAFLKENHPGPRPRDLRERAAWGKQWAAFLADQGYAAPGWPRRWGGMELPLSQQLIYHEEIAQSRIPAHPRKQVWTVGPVLMQHGTPEQCERFLSPMLRADELWCQGFSEPNAGSDLLGLRTHADRDGEEYVVNGQKVWTSGADTADWMYALIRTGTPESRQNGLTYLLIDMKSSGIDVRPIGDMSGTARFCETFFDDVRVPVANRVGGENQGWIVARATLGHERSTAFIGNVIRYRKILDELKELAQERNATSDPFLRQEFAYLESAVLIQRLNGMRVLGSLERNVDPGPISSISRLFYGQFEKRLHEVAMHVIGTDGLIARGDPRSVQRGRWVWGFLATRGSTIGAGTAEIQRNTLGERVLGLPSDPGMPNASDAADVVIVGGD
jgi:alkylation response protein AidB-like acyl-CoA dehydrogenase